MKPSQYNICLPYEDHYVIFNGVTKRFFQVSSQNKEAFLQILSAPDEYKDLSEGVRKRINLSVMKVWQEYEYCRRIIQLILFMLVPHLTYAQADSVKTNVADSVYKSVDLQNVTITGSNVTHYPDKDVWLITDSLRRGAYSVRELMGNLPGFYYNPISRSLSYQGDSGILFLLDGKEKRGSVGDLAHIRFEKIEVTLHPMGKYEDYDVVVNMITKENWKGYDVNLMSSNELKPSNPYEDFLSHSSSSGTYAYALPKFDMMVNYTYSHSNSHRNSNEHEKYTAYEQRSVNTGKPTSSSFNNLHNWWIDLGYQLSKGHTISFKYSQNRDQARSYNHKMMERDYLSGDTLTVLEDRGTYHHGTDHTATIAYNGSVKAWTLSSELTYDKYISDVTYLYDENRRPLYQTSYDNDKDYWYWDLDVTRSLGRKATINVGYANTYRSYESKSQSLLSESEERRNMAYASYSYALTDRLRVKMGLTYRNIREEYDHEENETQNIYSLNGRLSYRFARFNNLELTYSNNTSHPYQRQLNTIGRWVNPELYAVGNPNLKAYTTHRLYLRLSASPLILIADYNYSGNEISQVYKNDGNTTISTYENVKAWNFRGNAYLNHSFVVWGGNLRLNGTVRFDACYAEQYGEGKNTSCLRGGGSVSYSKGNLPSVTLQYNKYAHEVLTAQGKYTTGVDDWKLSLNHMMCKRRLMMSLTYTLPIAWGVSKYGISSMRSATYEYDLSWNRYETNKNMVSIWILYRFAKGKQIRRKTVQSKEEER